MATRTKTAIPAHEAPAELRTRMDTFIAAERALAAAEAALEKARRPHMPAIETVRLRALEAQAALDELEEQVREATLEQVTAAGGARATVEHARDKPLEAALAARTETERVWEYGGYVIETKAGVAELKLNLETFTVNEIHREIAGLFPVFADLALPRKPDMRMLRKLASWAEEMGEEIEGIKIAEGEVRAYIRFAESAQGEGPDAIR